MADTNLRFFSALSAFVFACAGCADETSSPEPNNDEAPHEPSTNAPPPVGRPSDSAQAPGNSPSAPAPPNTDPPSAPVQGISVTTQAQLDAALASAKGGEVFALSGNFNITLVGKTYSSPVMLTSMNPNARAKLGFTKMTNVTNVTFKGIDFHMVATDTNAFIAKILTSHKITLDSVHVYGTLDNDSLDDPMGVWLSGSDITVVNSEFEQLHKGLNIGGENVLVKNNSFHHLREDGADFGWVKNAVIENNRFTAFDLNPGDHRDGIQFMTVGSSSSSSDIVVRNNVIVIGDGASCQGIFMTDQQGDLPYLRVTIENNLVAQTYMANGIMVANGNDITIKNNTVVSPTDDNTTVWIRLNGVSNLKRSGNVAESGGDKTPAQAGINLGLLTTANMKNLQVADLVVAGVGYQP
jgi:hypothetical protein